MRVLPEVPLGKKPGRWYKYPITALLFPTYALHGLGSGWQFQESFTLGFTTMTVETIMHLGNVLYLVAFAVRDILWLRIITVLGTLFLLPYYYCCRAEPLYESIIWSSLFIGINVVQIGRLIFERRPVFLGEREQRIYRANFHTLSPREFVRLLSIAEWKQAEVGEELLVQDQTVSELMLLSSGRGSVEIDGRFVAEVTSGQFIGEMGFLTQEEASARVVAATPTEYLSWPADKLREMLANSSDLHLKLQGVLGNDLVEKLRQESMDAAHPSRIMKGFKKSGMT